MRLQRGPARASRATMRSERGPSRAERGPSRASRATMRSERGPSRASRATMRSERGPALAFRATMRSRGPAGRGPQAASRPSRPGIPGLEATRRPEGTAAPAPGTRPPAGARLVAPAGRDLCRLPAPRCGSDRSKPAAYPQAAEAASGESQPSHARPAGAGARSDDACPHAHAMPCMKHRETAAEIWRGGWRRHGGLAAHLLLIPRRGARRPRSEHHEDRRQHRPATIAMSGVATPVGRARGDAGAPAAPELADRGRPSVAPRRGIVTPPGRAAPAAGASRRSPGAPPPPRSPCRPR